MEPLRYFCCFILVFTTVNALKFKEYKHFLEEQSRNQTFMKLFDQHIKKFNRAKSKKDIECHGCKTQLIFPTKNIDTYRSVGGDGNVDEHITLARFVDSGRYDTRDDFTVVNQPFLSETKIPINTRQENRQPDANTRTHQFSSTSVAGIVIGALCIMIVVSLSVYYLKQKRKQNSVERYQLLQGSSPNYTEI
ncbi:PLB [Mytilus edulis]|uniref:PLB1 n=1 Tax=Mytilus edulis TaxID=6550 RepID=A0A8S3SS64_MYTED|nr:PLB [Mytilus edulis]